MFDFLFVELCSTSARRARKLLIYYRTGAEKARFSCGNTSHSKIPANFIHTDAIYIYMSQKRAICTHKHISRENNIVMNIIFDVIKKN